MVRSPRLAASSRTCGATPCAEKTTTAPSGTSLGLVHEDRAALLQRADHVRVVHDLLADVDGRAVALQRLLDGLHRTVNPRAVAAGLREQDASGGTGMTPMVGEPVTDSIKCTGASRSITQIRNTSRSRYCAGVLI